MILQFTFCFTSCHVIVNADHMDANHISAHVISHVSHKCLLPCQVSVGGENPSDSSGMGTICAYTLK